MILCFDKQGNKCHWILTSCMYTTNRNVQLVNVPTIDQTISRKYLVMMNSN